MITRGNTHGSSHGGGPSSLGYLFGGASPEDGNVDGSTNLNRDGKTSAVVNEKANANARAKEKEKVNVESLPPAGLPSDRLWRQDAGPPPPMTASQLQERKMTPVLPSNFTRGSPSGRYGNSSCSVAEIMRSAIVEEGSTASSNRSRDEAANGQMNASSRLSTTLAAPVMHTEEPDGEVRGKREGIEEVHDQQQQKQEGKGSCKKKEEGEEELERDEVEIVALAKPSFGRRDLVSRLKDVTTSVAQIMSDGAADLGSDSTKGGQFLLPWIESPHRSPSKSGQSSRGPSSPAKGRENLTGSLQHVGEAAVPAPSLGFAHRSLVCRFKDPVPASSPSFGSLKMYIDSWNQVSGAARSFTPGQLRGRTPYSPAEDRAGEAAGLLPPVPGAGSVQDDVVGGQEVPVLSTPKFGRRSKHKDMATRCVADCLAMDGVEKSAQQSSTPEWQLQERLSSPPHSAKKSEIQWGDFGAVKEEKPGSTHTLQAGYPWNVSSLSLSSSSKSLSSRPVVAGSRQYRDMAIPPSPSRLEPLDVSARLGPPVAAMLALEGGGTLGLPLTPLFAAKSSISTVAEPTCTVADCLRQDISTRGGVVSPPSLEGDDDLHAPLSWKSAGKLSLLSMAAEEGGSPGKAASFYRPSIDADNGRQLQVDLASTPLASSSSMSPDIEGKMGRTPPPQLVLSSSVVSLHHRGNEDDDLSPAFSNAAAATAAPAASPGNDDMPTARQVPSGRSLMLTPLATVVKDASTADHGEGSGEEDFSPLLAVPLLTTASVNRVSKKVLLESLFPRPAAAVDADMLPQMRSKSFHRGIAMNGPADRNHVAMGMSKDDTTGSNGSGTSPISTRSWARRGEQQPRASSPHLFVGEISRPGRLDSVVVASEEDRVGVSRGGEPQSTKSAPDPIGKQVLLSGHATTAVMGKEEVVGDWLPRSQDGGEPREAGMRRAGNRSLPTSPVFKPTNSIMSTLSLDDAAPTMVGIGNGYSASDGSITTVGRYKKNKAVRSAWVDDCRGDVSPALPAYQPRRASAFSKRGSLASTAGGSINQSSAGANVRNEWDRPRTAATKGFGGLDGEKGEAEDDVSAVAPASKPVLGQSSQ